MQITDEKQVAEIAQLTGFTEDEVRERLETTQRLQAVFASCAVQATQDPDGIENMIKSLSRDQLIGLSIGAVASYVELMVELADAKRELTDANEQLARLN